MEDGDLEIIARKSFRTALCVVETGGPGTIRKNQKRRREEVKRSHLKSPEVETRKNALVGTTCDGTAIYVLDSHNIIFAQIGA
jgi:hypothetical protein